MILNYGQSKASRRDGHLTYIRRFEKSTRFQQRLRSIELEEDKPRALKAPRTDSVIRIWTKWKSSVVSVNSSVINPGKPRLRPVNIRKQITARLNLKLRKGYRMRSQPRILDKSVSLASDCVIPPSELYSPIPRLSLSKIASDSSQDSGSKEFDLPRWLLLSKLA